MCIQRSFPPTSRTSWLSVAFGIVWNVQSTLAEPDTSSTTYLLFVFGGDGADGIPTLYESVKLPLPVYVVFTPQSVRAATKCVPQRHLQF